MRHQTSLGKYRVRLYRLAPFTIAPLQNMEAIAKQVKAKLAPERSKVIDDILEEYPSCNSEQVEEEADRRMLDSYIDAFIKQFQKYSSGLKVVLLFLLFLLFANVSYFVLLYGSMSYFFKICQK